MSVIICARNEAVNLQANLEKILTQSYDNFEVIVVNDASTDATQNVLQAFQKQYPHLRIINISEKKILGKKGALAAGIEAAQNDWLLLTDADCYPLSTNWILGMMAGVISEKIQIILNYAPYEICDSSFLNKFIRFETVWTATQYLSFALIGQPYMGVGRNLLYHKKLYNQVGGFRSHVDIASGDDDLFVNQVITNKNFSIILTPETFMQSLPNRHWKGYFMQKKRHLSASTRYLMRHKILLGAISISHFGLFVTGVMLIYLKISTMFVVTSVVVRTVVVWYLYGKILIKLHEKHLFKYIPILDFSYVFFYIIFTPFLILRTSHNWKRSP